jgi:predicted extracellular nuclease
MRFYGPVRGVVFAPDRRTMSRMRRLLFILACALSALLSALAASATAASADGVVAIQSIQGPGARSALAGRRVVTEGAVTLVERNGFFLEQADATGDARASRGLFVFTGGVPDVAARQCVRLAGRVVEFDVGAVAHRPMRPHPVTELHAITGLRVLRDACDVAPVALAWPLAEGDDLERVEGMLVTLRGPWTVQQNVFLGRSCQLRLATGGRLQAPTNVVRPGAAARALARSNARRSLVLDARAARPWPGPAPCLVADGTPRAGDTLDEITGVVDHGPASARGEGPTAWKIHPLQAPRIVRTNPRTTAPAPVGGDLRIASANVDNYFSTLADGRRGCGPRHLGNDCRGARDAPTFERQRARIVEMLASIDADVVALMEIENNGATALRSLVDALNERVGAATWQPVDESTSAGGNDATRVGLIYKPARLMPVGPARSDRDPVHGRWPLAQSFASIAGGRRFNVIASHFKSRRCDGATGADRDRGDLQGCWNARRVAQARALARFAGAVARATGVAHTLLVGDFNAYAREDPLTLLLASGFADQVARFDPQGYSYVYDGAAGRLDGVFASAAMATRVTGVTAWHVDADEPVSAGSAGSLAPGAAARAKAERATPWRASDHDPMVVGLRLADP